MGSYQWLKILFDDLVTWLGRAFSAWIQKLIITIKSYWEEQIAPIVRYFFGVIKQLYVIFYRTVKDIVNMEIWDPYSLQYGQQSQIFEITKAPHGVQIPREEQRNTSQVFQLENPLPPLTA